MFCSKCGKQIPDGSKFCQHCGTNMTGFIQKEPYASTNSTVVLSTHKIYKKKSFRLITFSTIAAILVIILLAVYSFSPERLLIGKWQIGTIDHTPEYMQFFSDGTVFMGNEIDWEENNYEQYDYQVNDNILTIEGDGKEIVRTNIYINGDSFRLYTDDDFVVYRRI